MTIYTTIICEMTGVQQAVAEDIESIMRLSHPTLDHLSRPAFRREVKIAQAAMDDPEVQAYVESARHSW